MYLDFIDTYKSIITASCSLDEMRDIVPNQRENPISAGLAQSGLLQRSSAPINIPNSQLTNSLSGKYLKSILKILPT